MQTFNVKLTAIDLRLIKAALISTCDSVTGESSLTNTENQHFVSELLALVKNTQIENNIL